MPDTQDRQDDVQPSTQDRYAEPVSLLHWIERPERLTVLTGNETAVLLVGVVDSERKVLYVGSGMQWERTAEDAEALLHNYARPDGPLQNPMFSAAGLRGVGEMGETLWEETHYSVRRPVRHLA